MRQLLGLRQLWENRRSHCFESLPCVFPPSIFPWGYLYRLLLPEWPQGRRGAPGAWPVGGRSVVVGSSLGGLLPPVVPEDPNVQHPSHLQPEEQLVRKVHYIENRECVLREV